MRALKQHRINETSISLVRGDITEQTVDAIVNAANSELVGVGGQFAAGVDGAIHRKGGNAILEQCRQIRQLKGPCPAGEAVLTSAGRLHAKHVIHAVGPVWRGGMMMEGEILASTYRRSLELASEAGDRSIAFPSISTGAFGYPASQAARIALEAVAQYCQSSNTFIEIRFVLFDDVTYQTYQCALAEIAISFPPKVKTGDREHDPSRVSDD